MTVQRSLWCAALLLVAEVGPGRVLPARAAGERGVDSTVERGDQSIARGQLHDALTSFQAALARNRGHFGALCGLAHVEAELSEEATGEERRRLVASAVEHARAAVKAAPDDAIGHVWLVVALRCQAQMEGPRTRAGLWREIKSELDRALGIDPGIARAYLERGRWNRRLASRGWWERSWSRALLARVPRGASLEDALRDFEKAAELAPRDIEVRMELARTYLRLDRYGEARRELQMVVAIPAVQPRDPRLQSEAREQLERLGRRG